MGFDWGQALNIGGGAARGVLEGQEDLRRKAEFNYLQEKRKNELEQIRAENAAAATAQQDVQQQEAPSYDMSGAGMTQGLDQDQYTKIPGKTVAPSGRLGALAKAYTSSGKPQLMVKGAELYNASSAMQKQEQGILDEEKRRQVLKEIAPMHELLLRDPDAFLLNQGLNYSNDKVNNGQRIRYSQNPDGSISYIHYDEKTGESVGDLQTVKKEDKQKFALDVLERIAGHKLGYISPEDYTAQDVRRRALETLKLEGRKTAASEMIAQTTKEFHGLGGVMQQNAIIDANVKAAEIKARQSGTELDQLKAKDLKDFQARHQNIVALLDDPIQNREEIFKQMDAMQIPHADKYILKMTEKDSEGNAVTKPFNTVQDLVDKAFARQGYAPVPGRSGFYLPKGTSVTEFTKLQAAQDKSGSGVQVATMFDPDTKEPRIVYVSPKSRLPYATPEDAKKGLIPQGIDPKTGKPRVSVHIDASKEKQTPDVIAKRIAQDQAKQPQTVITPEMLKQGAVAVPDAGTSDDGTPKAIPPPPKTLGTSNKVNPSYTAWLKDTANVEAWNAQVKREKEESDKKKAEYEANKKKNNQLGIPTE